MRQRTSAASTSAASASTASVPLWALLAALIGGMCGTALRLLVDTLLPHSATDFALSTLIINVVGSFALGVVVARLWGRSPEWLKAGLGTGLLGSFTTFSAVMVSLVAQSTSGLWMMAALYLALSLLFGFIAAAVGLRVGRVSTPIDWVDE